MRDRNLDNQNQDKERGAVLLTTLLLLTIMAAITVAIMDDILFSVRRTTNIEAAEQMDWYGRGGEEYAKTWLTNTANDDQLVISQAIVTRAPLTLPIDENGGFRLLIEDGRNCFNVNQFTNNEQVKESRRRLSILLTGLDFDSQNASSIAAHIQDWIDSDLTPEHDGAEEYIYLSKTPPFHPANTMMTDITELRAIEGIDEDIFERISPYLCAMADDKANKLNINTLRFDQAPLLASVFGAQDGLKAAQAIIADRPKSGYESIEAVWQSPSIIALGIKGVGKDQVTVRTDRVIVNLQVDYRGQVRTKAIMYALGQDGDQRNRAKLIARRGMF